jgi:2-hydroxychromene-2-carboxylate isomerase
MNGFSRFTILTFAAALTFTLAGFVCLQKDGLLNPEKSDTDIMRIIRAHPAELLSVVRDAAENERAEAMTADWKRQLAAKPVLGPDPARAVHGTEGPVVTVFTDFDCAWCRRAHALYRGLAWRDTRRFLCVSPEDRKAAAAALGIEAADPAAGARFHDLLMEDTERAWKEPAMTERVLAEFAAKAGFPKEKLASILRDPRWQDTLREDAGLARRLHLDATPSFVIDGRLTVRGAPPRRLMAEALSLASTTHSSVPGQGGN